MAKSETLAITIKVTFMYMQSIFSNAIFSQLSSIKKIAIFGCCDFCQVFIGYQMNVFDAKNNKMSNEDINKNIQLRKKRIEQNAL